ncbi:MAG: ATP-binding protein [Acidobacteria bacterium]|nr:ATP-binding protein [Acidobacteriota bacterium]
MPKENRSILLVNDNPAESLLWRQYLQQDDNFDWSFVAETSAAKAAKSLARRRPDCILVAGSPSALKETFAVFGEEIKSPQMAVIAITDSRDEVMMWLNGSGAHEWLNRRAVSPDGLCQTVRHVVEMTRMQKLADEQCRQIEELNNRLVAEREQMLLREQRAREMAEALSRDKDEFIAIVSHELRAPLNAILGWVRVLKNGKFETKTFDHAVDVIERSARMQQQLIEDLLDTARVIKGKLRLVTKPVDLVQVIEAATDGMRPAADAKGIGFSLTLKGRNNVITGDPDRLQQVVWNLLSNAVKFTSEGGRVEVRLERADPYLQITVSDTGRGISQDLLPFIFNRFQQDDSAGRQRQSGLGLGLALVRHLVELHGGTTEAESPGEEQGATFRVKLPMRALRQQVDEQKQTISWEKAGTIHSRALEGVRALVVDDEADARDLVATLLRQYGAHVATASSAAEALAFIKKSEASTRPDILVSDIGMPEEDGYSLIESVRRLTPEMGGSIPAIALTAYGRASDRIRALSAGFQRHMPKPVEPAELVMVIYGLTGSISAIRNPQSEIR